MSKYDGPTGFYPGTNVLVNRYNIKNINILDKFEAVMTAERLYQLHKNPIYGAFGLKHIQKIHSFIFQDIYPFAGTLRDVQIAKGSTVFAHPMHIQSYATDIFKQLKDEKYLKGLDKENFSDRASYYLSEINILHPFREGNGRAQREFLRLLAMKNGYELDWSVIKPEQMLKASIESVTDTSAFKELFNVAIQNEQPDLSLIKFYQSCKPVQDLEL